MQEMISLYGRDHLNILLTKDQSLDWPKDWSNPIIITEPEKTPRYNVFYYKINWFIQNNKIENENYYWVMCDDDSIENGVVSAIENMNDDIIFISMKRGYNIPEGLHPISRHPTNTLYANPENICIGGIGIEQMIIKGKIFKNLVYNINTEYGDGEMAIFLKENYTIKYRLDLFVLFNFFEKGRWDVN
jgi:hypothetical protein